MLLFSFSVFSDQWSLKTENENNDTKTLTTDVSYVRLGSLEIGLYMYKNLPWMAGITFDWN